MVAHRRPSCNRKVRSFWDSFALRSEQSRRSIVFIKRGSPRGPRGLRQGGSVVKSRNPHDTTVANSSQPAKMDDGSPTPRVSRASLGGGAADLSVAVRPPSPASRPSRSRRAVCSSVSSPSPSPRGPRSPMSLTTQCPRCRTVLNLPDDCANRRLRCPKCETRFYSGDEDSTPPRSAPAVDSAGLASGALGAPRSSELALPVRPAAPRDTLDLPLLDDSGPPAKRSTAGPAASLFDDIPPPRKLSRAEARQKPRRCPTCGSLVLGGMSLCERCGLDLDTGVRHTVEVQDDDDYTAPVSAPSLPASILLIGIAALAASAVLMALSLVVVDQPVGKASFGLVCGFGLYASIQFLRARSFKLLLIAMMLGAIVDVIGLIVLPIVAANEAPVVMEGASDPGPNLDDADDVKIKNMAQDPDLMRKVGWGIGLLLFDAAGFIYLSTATSLHRHFHRGQSNTPPF